MPDIWEGQNNLDSLDPSDAAADSDGDGVSNLAEFNAGTDPNQAANAVQPKKNGGGGGSLGIELGVLMLLAMIGSRRNRRLRRSRIL